MGMVDTTLVLTALTTGAVAAGSAFVLAVIGVATFVANSLLYRKTNEQNTATLGVAVEQMEIARGQLEAIDEQAEIARRALQLQLTPRLIPGGAETCQVGPPEQLTPEPQPITMVPILLVIANAGNGVAIIETDRAEAKCISQGTHRPMTVMLPPALAPGAQAQIKLIRSAAMEDRNVTAGEQFEVSIPYHGDEDASGDQQLRFLAQYFNDSQWRLEVLSSRD